MKLVHAEYGIEIELKENQIPVLVIESPEKFSELIQELYLSKQGGEGKVLLSEADKLLNMGKFLELVVNPFAIDVNENYHWKYIQGTNIQIVPPEYLKDHFVDQILILATGYSESIINGNLDYVYHGGEFVNIIEKEFV